MKTLTRALLAVVAVATSVAARGASAQTLTSVADLCVLDGNNKVVAPVLAGNVPNFTNVFVSFTLDDDPAAFVLRLQVDQPEQYTWAPGSLSYESADCTGSPFAGYLGTLPRMGMVDTAGMLWASAPHPQEVPFTLGSQRLGNGVCSAITPPQPTTGVALQPVADLASVFPPPLRVEGVRTRCRGLRLAPLSTSPRPSSRRSRN